MQKNALFLLLLLGAQSCFAMDTNGEDCTNTNQVEIKEQNNFKYPSMRELLQEAPFLTRAGTWQFLRKFKEVMLTPTSPLFPEDPNDSFYDICVKSLKFYYGDNKAIQPAATQNSNAEIQQPAQTLHDTSANQGYDIV